MVNIGNSRAQANQYDKILQENLEITLPSIIRNVLNLAIVVSEELPDNVQHTKERKPDALKKVTDMQGNTYLLHLEFQLSDEKNMVFRMADYSIMLMRTYKLPLKQYVIYMKENKPSMPTSIDTENHKFSFDLIRISEIDYRVFLNSNDPEIKMLGILANFGEIDSNEAIKSIVSSIQLTAKGLDQEKIFKQLRIYAQIRRSRQLQIINAMESVSTFFKEENDFLYLKGEAVVKSKGEAIGQKKGEEKKSREVIENLIAKLALSDLEAAEIAKVDVDYVVKVRAELKKQGSFRSL